MFTGSADLSVATRSFCSLDRQTRLSAAFAQPDRYRSLFELLRREHNSIPAGAGLSYVGAGFGEGVVSVSMEKFDRILAFSAERKTITVEAGVRLGNLTKFLAARQLVLSVQPGYPGITVGGCIAANVHGKNPRRDGLFARCVTEMSVFHPDHGEIHCSATENAEVFNLTLGGLGLTGLIVSATLALDPLPSRMMNVGTQRFASPSEGFQIIASEAATADSVLGWLDLSKGSRWGTGVVSSYRYAGEAAIDPTAPRDSGSWRLSPSWARSRRPKWSLIGKTSIPLINRIYAGNQGRLQTVAFEAALYPSVGKEFYYDLYGDRGFHEIQMLVPDAAIDSLLSEVGSKLKRSEAAIGLATIKPFGGIDRHLDFDGSGFSFTLDVPDNPASTALLEELEKWVGASGAKINPMKYSRMTAGQLNEQYPEADIFRSRLRAYDPSRRFRSALSDRLQL